MTSEGRYPSDCRAAYGPVTQVTNGSIWGDKRRRWRNKIRRARPAVRDASAGSPPLRTTFSATPLR